MNRYAVWVRPAARRVFWMMADLRREAAVRRARSALNCADDLLERRVSSRLFLSALPLAFRMKFRGREAVVDGVSLTAVVAMEIRCGDGILRTLEFEIDSRRCTIRKAAGKPPDAAMSMRLADLIRMARGAVDGPLLMAAGRMAVSGDAFLLARFPGLFGLTTKPLLRASVSPVRSWPNSVG